MTPEEIRQIGMMLEKHNRETISSVSEIRQSIDELLEAHKEEMDKDTHTELWNLGFHDALLAAQAAVNKNPNPL